MSSNGCSWRIVDKFSKFFNLGPIAVVIKVGSFFGWSFQVFTQWRRIFHISGNSICDYINPFWCEGSLNWNFKENISTSTSLFPTRKRHLNNRYGQLGNFKKSNFWKQDWFTTYFNDLWNRFIILDGGQRVQSLWFQEWHTHNWHTHNKCTCMLVGNWRMLNWCLSGFATSFSKCVNFINKSSFFYQRNDY